MPDYYAGTARAKESQRRREEGERLDRTITNGPLPDRHYFCRTCGKDEVANMVPAGWYMLTKASGSLFLNAKRLGLYCSMDCLVAMLPRLQGIDRAATSGQLRSAETFEPFTR